MNRPHLPHRPLLPWHLLASLGLLTLLAGPAAAVDTSAWKCESCPFEKNGISGSVEAGLGNVSDDSAKFGEYSRLQQQGPFVSLGAQARWRGDNGYFGSLDAASDTGTLATEVGLEGRGALRLGYSEILRHLSDTARTPFNGVGSNMLTLPSLPAGGFPAGSTAAMPLDSTLHAAELGTRRQRWDIGARWTPGERWSLHLDTRHETRTGTQRLSGSFFSSAAQLVAPVDQVTDTVELSLGYATPRIQASLAYQASLFRNGSDSLTWTNPFTAIAPGATSGQMALAPDNQFHQMLGTAGWQVLDWLRLSGDLAVGRMTQDQAFVPVTSNLTLLAASPTVLALPARSLGGQVDTFNGSLRATATVNPQWRVNASYARDVRDNRTTSLAYPEVATDAFIGPTLRHNLPYDIEQDRLKLNADYRGSLGNGGSLKGSLGIDQDNRQRTYQERVSTRETNGWAKLGGQFGNGLGLGAKLSHAVRAGTTYGVATAIDPAENPLLRKYNLADRTRDSIGLRADMAVSETLSLGFNTSSARDHYRGTTIGLTDGRQSTLGFDASWALSDDTQLRGWLQTDRLRANQAGSQAYAAADWWAQHDDRSQVLGLGVKHTTLKGKLELTADFTAARSRSDVAVTTSAGTPAFPSATTGVDTLKLQATWQMSDKLAVLGGLWYERYTSADWHHDGVLPATVGNLLTLGDQPPQYNVTVGRVGVRYRF